MSTISVEDQLRLVNDYHVLMDQIRKQIPETLELTNSKRKSEKIAQEHFRKKGYKVLDGTVNGYRAIGWPSYWDTKPWLEKSIVDPIRSAISDSDFRKLQILIKDKNGCPDLMLIKNGQIEFVEVKSDNETVKEVSLEFFVRLGNKFPLSVFRIKRQKRA